MGGGGSRRPARELFGCKGTKHHFGFIYGELSGTACPTKDSNFMIVQQRISLLVGIVLMASSPCLAIQSGSRSTAPVGGSGSRVAPQPAFSPSQSFSAPSSSYQFQSPSFPQGQPVGGVVPAGQPLVQYPNQLGSPGVIVQDVVPYSVNPASPLPQSAMPLASGSSSGSSLGIPEPSLVDPIFEISDPNSPYSVDHSAWDCLLSCYMVTDAVGINRLRYGAVTPQDHRALKGYLQYLQSVDIRTLNRNEQLAFWFNLYNARTADIVLDNYPIRSIRQVKMKFTDFVGPFDDPGTVTVLGKPLSLNDIESGIVRPVWKDPRIHYALNCASYGCPNLSRQAWTAADLDSRLNSAASNYINSNRAIRRGVLGVHVSKIFKWYKDDFGGSDQAVLNHLSQYANPCTQQKLQGQQRIGGYFYDWSLNDGKITRRRLLEPIIR